MDPQPPSSSSHQPPNWAWPREWAGPSQPDSSGSSTSTSTGGSGGAARTNANDASSQDQAGHAAQPEQPEQRGQSGQPGQRHYKPRTCRICLEVVNPTTEIDDSAAGGLFASRIRVKYMSEDPELGRLISPCKCKGTQKYVHEGCLRAWRQSAPLSNRHYWRCPTCQFEYRIQRLMVGAWVSNWWTRGALTFLILLFTIFLLGFIADPIINLLMDPLGSITETIVGVVADIEAVGPPADEPATWSYHFTKGLFSLGLLGFVKSFFGMSPWHAFRYIGGAGRGGGRRLRGRGRERLENINWAYIAIGVFTFMAATWKLVNHVSTRVLDSASEMVVDVQGDEDDDDEDQTANGANGPNAPNLHEESRKDT